MSAIRKKDYKLLYEQIEKGLEKKACLTEETLASPKAKIDWIDEILDGVIRQSKTAENAYVRRGQSPV